ncbi:nitrate reductase molybdenum cofactor assembly chaperone [Entomomonas moraniae]|uniref:Nitrate reductase molybdenum cofactor assembly chaperone n=1 Tax=Entomomonas moraniae TaxID=2213226 RepID=A0A3Q9JLH4_9GAMM|nr:nitrate reductase molybdenum cofactor assembly chaperone [Entomomonas moraniae]AZS50476.1 nitrate reductase molybdenum cofactor assembly chaperone [Entomomonas moraniae]
MNIYKILSVLLCYPEQELIDSVPAIGQILSELQVNNEYVQPLLTELATNDLITLQENYVQTFDRTPTQSLHLFEHIHGEDRIRGQAMVDLMQEYQNDGFEVTANELPDYLPLFLEYLAVCETKKATELLGEAIDVIGHIESKLSTNNSTYTGIFKQLISLSPTQPKPLITPPIRDMDEALEKFGPSSEGVEPLLQLNTSSACITCESSARQVK